MRIVHLTQTTTREIAGGLEYHIAYLTDALKALGHETIVVRTSDLPPMGNGTNGAGRHAGVSHGGVTLLRRLARSARRFRVEGYLDTLGTLTQRLGQNRRVSKVVSYIESLKPDIVHQHSYLDGLALNHCLRWQYPLVFTNHTGAYLHLDRHAMTRGVQRRMMERFDAVIGPSRELLPSTKNSHYIPNGVDTRLFRPLPDDEVRRLRSKWDCEGRRVFLCPRRWAPTKGIIYLARALSAIKPETRERSVFLFAGNETPGYQRYQTMVAMALQEASGCDVRALGNLRHDDMVEVLNIADACVVPSLMEATSLTCLESMACGTPVLGSKTGGLLELIEDGGNGWFIPMKDEKALANKMDEIASLGGDQRARFRERALHSVEERFTWKVAASATEEVYRTVLQDWLVRRRAEWRHQPFGGAFLNLL